MRIIESQGKQVVRHFNLQHMQLTMVIPCMSTAAPDMRELPT
jgi:hypothetical protein